MKKLTLVLMAVGILCGYSLVRTESAISAPATFEIKGTIIDNFCAEANADKLPTFVKTHTKACALKCATGGYSILAENGKLYKFDAQADAMIEAFLKKPESKLAVLVKVQQISDDLTLISINNQN